KNRWRWGPCACKANAGTNAIRTMVVGQLLHDGARGAPQMPDVVITLNRSDIGAAIDDALDAIALEPLVAGKRVAVKPNETWASKEDTTGITQPDTLRAVLRHVSRFGPRELIVTGGSGAAETDEVFR